MTRSEFDSLYDANVRIVRSILYRIAPHSAGLDDLTQEVFLRAWRAQDSFAGHSSRKTWLCRIARNVAIDALRASKHEKSRGSAEEMAEVADKTRDPIERAFVHQVLSQLAPDDRILLLLLAIEDCSLSEVGEILDIPVGTVKSRSFAARQRFIAAHEVATADFAATPLAGVK